MGCYYCYDCIRQGIISIGVYIINVLPAQVHVFSDDVHVF